MAESLSTTELNEVQRLVQDALQKAPDFLQAAPPVPSRDGLRIALLKTGTMNQSLDTSATVDRLRLILQASLQSAGYRLVNWTQSKFELVMDIDRQAGAGSK